MCNCTPSIRTPFCGRGQCLPPKPEGARAEQAPSKDVFTAAMPSSEAPVSQQEIVSAINHHARELARLTATWPVHEPPAGQCDHETFNYCWICKTAREQRAVQPPGADERALRRMLAFAYSGQHLYGDDGELQDGRVPYPIDFVRDSVAEIEKKIFDRGMFNLAAIQAACEHSWDKDVCTKCFAWKCAPKQPTSTKPVDAHGPCTGCGIGRRRCEDVWHLQRKCCPECSHCTPQGEEAKP